MRYMQTYNPSDGFAASSPYTGEPNEVHRKSTISQSAYADSPYNDNIYESLVEIHNS